jgi:hypothetical protein
MGLKWIVHVYSLPTKVMHVYYKNFFVYHLVYISKKMLIFILYIVKQLDKSFHLNENLTKIHKMKFVDLISYIKKLFKFWKSYFIKTSIVIIVI